MELIRDPLGPYILKLSYIWTTCVHPAEEEFAQATCRGGGEMEDSGEVRGEEDYRKVESYEKYYKNVSVDRMGQTCIVK